MRLSLDARSRNNRDSGGICLFLAASKLLAPLRVRRERLIEPVSVRKYSMSSCGYDGRLVQQVWFARGIRAYKVNLLPGPGR